MLPGTTVLLHCSLLHEYLVGLFFFSLSSGRCDSEAVVRGLTAAPYLLCFRFKGLV
jgi:hypothetical protein